MLPSGQRESVLTVPDQETSGHAGLLRESRKKIRAKSALTETSIRAKFTPYKKNRDKHSRNIISKEKTNKESI